MAHSTYLRKSITMKLSPFDGAPLYRGNLHGHSTHSDGFKSPKEVIEIYKNLGYDFTCLSDHLWDDSSFAATTLCDVKADEDASFITIPSAELHCLGKSFDNDGLWHLVANGLPVDFKPADKEETAPQLIERAQKAGAFVTIAHPEWYALTSEEAMMVSAADAVEVYNHACFLEAARSSGIACADYLLQSGKNVHLTASDDSHFRLDDAGGGWVMVAAETLSETAIISALKQGAFYASSGPSITAIELQDSQLEIQSSAARSVIISGAGYEARNQNGHSLTKACFDLSDFKSPWFRVTVTDAANRHAWSNRYWVR